jgi:predicted ATPase
MLRSLIDSLRFDVGEPHAAATGLLAKVGGNPLFVLEVLRQAHAANVDWHRIAVPKRIVELMDRRLQGLSDGALTLARVAAIAGTDFSVALAESVTGLDALALASPWRELETSQLLRATAFTHDLAQAAVQQSIPESIAARVHANVASFL